MAAGFGEIRGRYPHQAAADAALTEVVQHIERLDLAFAQAAAADVAGGPGAAGGAEPNDARAAGGACPGFDPPGSSGPEAMATNTPVPPWIAAS